MTGCPISKFPVSLEASLAFLHSISVYAAHVQQKHLCMTVGIAKEPSSASCVPSSTASIFPPCSSSHVPVFLGPQFIADAAAMAAPAVVNITVTKDGLPVPQDHSGTGFIYSSNGCILTNAHVIADALPSSDGANGNSSNATSCSNSSADRSNSYHGTSTSGNGNGSSKPITVALQDGRIFQGSVLMFDRRVLPATFCTCTETPWLRQVGCWTSWQTECFSCCWSKHFSSMLVASIRSCEVA